VAKEFLSRRGFVVEEVNVAADAAARRRIVEATGQRTVPTFEVAGRFFVGWPESKDALLALVGERESLPADN